ncbi:multidrug resistance-associated protein 1-like isoform X3 [Portunus trituberculatus]|uniref:multidrug resistance-associated protein 1-like isoform X3 n=1 Tax=Portunus trituberculatus TaxID=210409 RepID=UPI001E1D046F|nr:multidrug resistance-associated protein 1-like isoform X3 [Portunus trituberculatus]
MTEEGGLDAFCNSAFLNSTLTWNTTNPDLTLCFERTVLVWVPCGYLWLLAPIEVANLRNSVDRLVPWSILNISKLVTTMALLVLQCVNLFYAVHQNSIGENVPSVDYVTPVIIFLSLILEMVFMLLNKKRGLQTSGHLFIFWFLLMVCGIPEFRTLIMQHSAEDEAYDEMRFITYMIYFPLICIMWFIHCFGEATPQYIFFPRGEKPNPETSASFLSRITFAWLDPLIWKGYRNPLVQEDMWNLQYENATNTIVGRWDKNWKRTVRKAEKKRDSHANGEPFNNAVHTETGGKAKKPLSILPTMVSTFGLPFLFGAVLKLLHDTLQFVSPQVLKMLISFTESDEEDAPQWQGYFYAVVMLVAAQTQSFILAQYFKKMYLIGLQVRSGIISAVYRKALLISSSSKKESTVGEIVNLMSVDAQRFMDLMAYINMLWSAPFQIALALYFLWEHLGPSVLAGVGVMVVLIPVNGFIANRTKILQISQMKSKDKRVKLMNEILNGIKVLKLYAWEPSFEEQVLGVRDQEIKVLKKAAYLNAGTSFIWTCTPFLVVFASLTSYVLVNGIGSLTSEKIFVSISLLNILRMPLGLTPIIVSYTIQANVSLKRLNKFLNLGELDPNSVSHDSRTEHPLVIENGTFSWGHSDGDEKPVLRGVNMTVEKGSLVAVVGAVGAGKSSLCSAILGEMEKQSGRVNVKGSVAYVAQQAWIQNNTVENNILFSQIKNDDFYNKCIQSCALSSDLEILPGGDQTEIGEKGINLSGGQKQRVSLARALYSDADIFLLDDPLSAVDSHVGKHIFDHVIGPSGMLKHKTRILVTHGITYLPKADKIVVLKNGEISEQGTYAQLVENKGEFNEFLLQYLAQEEDDDLEDDLNELENIKQNLENKIGREAFQRQISRKKQESESESIEGDRGRHNTGEKPKRESLKRPKKISESEKTKAPPAAGAVEKKAGEKLIQAEKAETGRVNLNVYLYYIRSIGITATLITTLSYVLSQGCSVGANVWLAALSEENYTDGVMDDHDRDLYLGVYTALGIGQAFFILGGAFALSFGSLDAAKKLHANLLYNVLRLPMSFFDTTPLGRLINRFSKDVDTLDNVLPWSIRSWLMCFVTVVATFAVIIGVTVEFTLVMIPTMIIYYFVQVLYVSTSRQLKRIESVTRSPIYSHFQESIQGAPTIRAFTKEHVFITESERRVDNNMVSSIPSIMSNRWLAVRLEFIGNIMTFSAAMFSVARRGNIEGGEVGLSISYALSVTQTLNWLVRMTSDVETNIVSVERIKEYTETPQEALWDIPNKKPSKDWPQEGVVKFNDYATRYREGLDLVIKDININIKAGEKIGIVGRTGAGKSSMTLGLFRIIEAAGGNITIDNVNIGEIGLHDLRSKLTIIPQDPVLFSGSLRMNLDPFNLYSDAEVWSALELAHLKEFVSSLSTGLQHEVSEGGDNLSVGQRQLVCLARALLRKTRVLVLDEATAAVDLETDDLIQQTIRQEFMDCTVLTIAHRLNTIMDYSRVLVLDRGMVKEFDSPSSLVQDKSSIFYGMAKDAGLA